MWLALIYILLVHVLGSIGKYIYIYACIVRKWSKQKKRLKHASIWRIIRNVAVYSKTHAVIKKHAYNKIRPMAEPISFWQNIPNNVNVLKPCLFRFGQSCFCYHRNQHFYNFLILLAYIFIYVITLSVYLKLRAMSILNH